MLCSFWCRHLSQKKQNIHQPAGLITSAKMAGPVLPPHLPHICTCLHAPTHDYRYDAYTHCTHDAYTDHTHCRLLSHPCTSSASLLTPSADSSAPQCSRKLTQKKSGKPSRFFYIYVGVRYGCAAISCCTTSGSGSGKAFSRSLPGTGKKILMEEPSI